MKLAVLKEKTANETRVAITPDIVKEYTDLGIEVFVQTKAGDASGYKDAAFKQAGAKIAPDGNAILKTADIVLKVQPPTSAEINAMKKSTVLVGMLAANLDEKVIKKYADLKISAFAIEMLPRITRAQNMDVLSSQTNLAGYKAVIDAVYHLERAVPMMMTAAGTIKPAKALILGAGVAGLQAIATAKRLGAVVSAFDVRAEVKEQVESLGATFIEVDDGKSENLQTKEGYAKETSEAYKKKQADLIHQTVKEQDIVICTALIPGRPAPMLLPEKMLKDMQPGAVVVDLATQTGGNCAWSIKDKVVEKQGLTIIGHENMAGRIAKDASNLYARNLFNFVSPMVSKKLKRIRIQFEDEISQSTLLAHDGKVVHKSFIKKPASTRKKAATAESTAAKKAPSKTKTTKAPTKPARKKS